MDKLKSLFGRRATTPVAAERHTPELPAADEFEKMRAERDQLRAERDGYKNAYEITATELGILRTVAGPWVRPESAAIPHGPSIFVVTLPKSGTVFIGHTLRQTLGYDFTSTLVTPTPFKNLMWPTMALDFNRGGMVSVSHMEPDAVNLNGLIRFKITKGVLHIRDPRAALHSWWHFHHDAAAKAKAGTGSAGDIGPPPTGPFMTWSTELQIDHMIQSYFFPAVAWIEAWVIALERNDELNFMVTTHEKLSADPAGYFADILQFYGLDTKIAVLEKSADLHFRSGDNDEWRQTLTVEQTARVNSLIPDILWDRFDWKK